MSIAGFITMGIGPGGSIPNFISLGLIKVAIVTIDRGHGNLTVQHGSNGVLTVQPATTATLTVRSTSGALFTVKDGHDE